MMRVVVYHDLYGCQTGCCGHTVAILEGDEDKDDATRSKFEFEHPYRTLNTDEDKRQWAKEFAKNVIEEAWPECLPSIDWESIRFDEVNED